MPQKGFDSEGESLSPSILPSNGELLTSLFENQDLKITIVLKWLYHAS